MKQTREAMAQNLAERWCWQAARRDDSRVARRLYRTPVVDGVSQRDEGALLDAFFSFLEQLGVVDGLGDVQGTAGQREMVPVLQDLRLDSLKTLFGIERMQALPAWLLSAEALMRLVGFNAQPVRQGVCPWGAAPRQGPRTTGPIGPEALAENLVTLSWRDLEALFKGVIRSLAQARGFTAKVTGIVDATALETTAQDEGCGHVTRQRKITDTRGKVHEIAVTVDGWKLMVGIDARTKRPLAGQVGPINAHEGRSMRALVPQARINLAGHARWPTVVVDQGFWDGIDRWWLDPHGILLVVPATENMAVTIDAQAQAAAGEGVTVGRRAHTVGQGQGNAAWSARLETEVVGMTGLTTDEPYGPPEPGRHHHRRAFQPHPIHAVVVRTWPHRDDGPGGNTVFLTKASVEQPLRPFADDDERRLIENCGIKERTQPWSVKPPPQKTARAVRVHVMFTWRLFALATAYRWPGAQEEPGGEPVGWQRWRRQLREQTRNHVMVFAQDCDGIVHRAEDSLLLGVTITDRPPGIGTGPQVLATSGLTAHR